MLERAPGVSFRLNGGPGANFRIAARIASVTRCARNAA